MADIFFDGELHNDKLKELMGKMHKMKSEQLMLDVLSEAARSSFLVPVTGEVGSMSFHAVSDEQARRFLAVYSDSDDFKKFTKDPNVKAVEAKFEDLLECVLAPDLRLDGMVVNPGSEEVIFGSEMLKMINDQIHSPSDVKVGEPDHYPPELEDKARAFLEDDKRVKAIYVRLFVKKDDESTGWIFVLDADCSKDEIVYICDTFNRYIKPYTDSQPSITVPITEDYAQAAIKGINPLVKRKGD
ncbi:SseB protein C-terminal domain-containing protein [Ruminococcaceae bacterium KH2T8]|nr:SseB protein C-terminal domain-containing protein [Ruminococcaceae bacterium KH2T8]